MQLELLKRRKRSKPFNALPPPTELQMHISIATRLRFQCKPGIVWWHCPNGELREDSHGAKLKAMGVRPGVSDLEFAFRHPTPNLYLELKARGRGLTPEQELFRDQVRAIGHKYEWTDSLDDAIRILRSYNVLP